MINKKKILCNDKTWDIFHLGKVSSTMNEIKKESYSKYNNLAIYADSQTEGKGRRDNCWVSRKGNLFLSLKITNIKIRQFFIFNYIVGLTVYDSIVFFLNCNKNIYIKWPNDIILNNRKLAGIIVEFSSIGKKIDNLYIGIGVNISHSPNDLKYKTTFLNSNTKRKIAIAETINLILTKITLWENIYYSHGANFIIKEWMNRSHKLGSYINFREKNELIKGVYKGIEEDGAIKINIKNKIFKFYNKEILI